jgi:hypothetical protein
VPTGALRDAAFDHLDAHAAVGDVLRRHDRAAQVKAGRAIDVADRLRDRDEVRLRYLLAETGLIGRREAVARDSRDADQVDAAEYERQLVVRDDLGPRGQWHPQRSHRTPLI